MKNLMLAIFVLAFSIAINAQSILTIDECYVKARENYPLIKQKDYIVKSRDYNISNVWKGYFPQITIIGQATYQSDVTSLPISFPGVKIESLTKDQYKAVADVSQVIYDGGIMSSQAQIQKSIAESDDQRIEIELLKVKERINQIYFGILLFDSQISQTELVKKDLNVSLAKLSAALKNGTATKPNVDIILAELLKIDQKEIELKANRNAFVDMLGLLINQKLDEFVQLKEPIISSTVSDEINRPELKLFYSQQKTFEGQSGISISKILPKATLFFQGGFGKPTLNMLKNNFDWYYMAGARLSWSPSNLYTYDNETELIELNKKSIEAQKEAFLLNTKISLKQQSREIEKLIELIKVDQEIIEIRKSVKLSAQAQMENGVITSNDFIRELNAEDLAKQNLSMHSIQLMLAKFNRKITTGN